MAEILGVLFAALVIWARIQSLGNEHVPMPPRDRPKDWKRAADRCGLQVTGGIYPRLKGRAGPVEVSIETFGKSRKDTWIEVVAPVAPDLEKVAIRSRSGPPERDVETGDPAFDASFTLEGPVPQLFALLDSETRRQLCAVNAAGRLEISGGRIQAVLSEDAYVSDVLPSLFEVCKRLGTSADIPRSLADNVKRDFDGGVRLQNLLLLLRELPGDPATTEALRAACSDWSSAVRLQAAKALGAEGRDTLLAIAKSLEDDAMSAEAVSALARELPAEQAKTLLDRAAASGHPRTALACVQALGEELLIQTLRHEQADIRVAAANALGDKGSAVAVLALQEAAERFPLDRKLRHATRQAIAEIQSRAEGASPGQLSLATDGGQLSLAHDPAGQLSLGEAPSAD